MSIRRSAPLLSLALLCGAALAPAARAQDALPGFDPRDLDTQVAACGDFHQYASGGWLKAHPVPAGLGSWGTFDEMLQRGLLQQRALLEAAAGAPQDDLDRLLGALYASGMDEAAIEAAGTAPLAPLLQRIDALQKPRHFAPLLADLHARGLPVLFDFGVADDLQEPSRRLAYAGQGGLGLPDRDYYLRQDPATQALTGAYRAYVERLLSLAGSRDAARDAAHVLAIETRLAQASQTRVQQRDPKLRYRVATVKELHKQYPALDLRAFLKRQGLKRVERLSLAPEAYFAAIEQLAATQTPEQWRAYFRFHVAHALAPYLPRGFQDAHEALFVRTLRGSKEALPRWRRVLATVDALAGAGLGHRYAQRHLPDAAQAAAETLVRNVIAAQRAALEEARWLGAPARSAALAKLEALDLRVGRPPDAPDYAGLAFDRASYAGNVLAAAQWRHRRGLASLEAKAADAAWPLPAHAVNAYYDPARNQLVLPAGFLQPPLFDPAVDAALNYGGLGALAAHELTHAFDAIGATFDAQGRLQPWLSPEDANGFALRTRPLEAQYDAYPALGPVKVSGRLTLAENVADLAGLQVAWRAFRAAAPGDAKIDGHTPAQRFFLGWARVWRRNYTDEALTVLLQTDVHAPARARVNGPLANLEPFATAFACKAGPKSFVRTPEARVSVW